jgi:hypothetical protein
MVYLFIYTVSSIGYTESKSMITVNNELDWTWKNVTVAQFEVLPLQVWGKPQTEVTIAGLRAEIWTWHTS